MPRPCFSGVENDEAEGEEDLEDLCFWRFELMGELVTGLASVSDELSAALYASILESPLGTNEACSPELAGRGSGVSCMPRGSGASFSSSKNNPFSKRLSTTGDPGFSAGRIALSCLPRRKIVS